jgi:gliding motility-associated-like protein
LGNLVNLEDLWLNNNQLTGPIPIFNVESTLYIENNYFDFSSIEPNIGATYSYTYSPQLPIMAIDTIYFNENEEGRIKFSIGGSANNYQWYKNGNPISDQISDELTIDSVSLTDDGNYKLEVTSAIVTDLILETEEIRVIVTSAIVTDLILETIVINAPTTPRDKVFVYNAVSPNGDGLHDFLKILDLEFFRENQVVIYDRRGNEEWSQEGYSNTDLTKAFIGVNSDGKDMLNGTYYYFISLISNSGSTYTQSGFFLLHR